MLRGMTSPTAVSPTLAGSKAITTWLILVAMAVLLTGVLLGSVTTADCGSPWFPQSESLSSQLDGSLGMGSGNFDEDCQQRFGSRGDLGAVLVGLAGLLGLGAVLVRNQERMAEAARQPVVTLVD
jgi:hypothetical protein